MSIPLIAKKKAQAISTGILLIGLGVVAYTNTWWPEIMLVIGLSLVVKQYLRGRTYDMIISILVFGGIYLFYKNPLSWNILMPVLFVVGGVYLIAKELFFPRWRTGKEEVEDVRLEIESGRDEKK